MPKYFFKYAWQQSRLWTIIFILFIIAQLFFTYKGVENFPFLNYGMYSQPITKLESLNSYELQVNKKPFKVEHCSCFSSHFLSYQIKYFHQWQTNKFNDPILNTIKGRFEGNLKDTKMNYLIKQLSNRKNKRIAFSNWLKDYLSCCLDHSVERIDLKVKKHAAKPPYALIKTNEYRIYPTD